MNLNIDHCQKNGLNILLREYFQILVSQLSAIWQVSLSTPAATKYLSVHSSAVDASDALTEHIFLSYLAIVLVW